MRYLVVFVSTISSNSTYWPFLALYAHVFDVIEYLIPQPPNFKRFSLPVAVPVMTLEGSMFLIHAV
jgi:uncharacterized membrane protein